MGATSSASQTTDEEPLSKEEKRKRRELKIQLEHFYICVESGSATQVLEILRKYPTIAQEKPPTTLPHLSTGISGHLHAIHVALQKGHYGVVKVLLEADPSCVNAYREPLLPWDYSSWGEYPIQSLMAMSASLVGGGSDLLMLLLESKADINCLDSKQKSPPVLIALKNGNISLAKRLLEYKAEIHVRTKADIDANALDILQTSTTYCSASNEISEFISFLAEKGFDINSILPASNETPIFNAVRVNNQNLVMALIKNKADLSYRDVNNNSILQVCITNTGNMVMFKELVDAGANVFDCDNWGNTILHTVSQSYYFNTSPEMVEHLLELGIDPERKNSSNQTPLDIAIQYGYREIVKTFLRHNIGVYSDHTDINNHPLLIRFVQSSWQPEFDLLVDMGADTNVVSSVGVHPTALHIAVSSYFPLHRLIESGAIVNATDSNGDTPLHYLLSRNGGTSCYEMVKVLVDAQADVNLENSQKMSPLKMYACPDVKVLMEGTNK